MPNWVYNDIEIEGKPDDIRAFLEKAAQPNEWLDKSYDFSFTNFVAPGADVDYDKDWYKTNVDLWGVKWDVCNSADVQVAPGDCFATIRFESAWSIPTPAFEAIVEQHPELDFVFKSTEEQGWGSEYCSTDPDENGVKELMLTDQWDIPESHSEWIQREGECRGCVWDDDPDSRYKDCPPMEEEESNG